MTGLTHLIQDLRSRFYPPSAHVTLSYSEFDQLLHAAEILERLCVDTVKHTSLTTEESAT